MHKEYPLVSIIITTYNRKGILKRAIESARNQRYPNTEIIVVDDNSDYDINSHIEEYVDGGSFRLLINEKNRGANWSRKRGIEEAAGEFIAFLDDDDYWEENKIRKQYEKFHSEGSKVGVVTTGRKYLNSDRGVYIPAEKFDQDNLIKNLLCRQNPIGGFSCVMVEKSAINRVGLPDTNLQKFQDLEWYIRLATSFDFRSVQEPLVLYDADPDRKRMTDIDIKEKDTAYDYIINKHSEIIHQYNWMFSRKVHGYYLYRKSENRFKSRQYQGAIYYGFRSIIKYPFLYNTYIIILVAAFGDKGLWLARKLKSTMMKIRTYMINR